MKKAFLMPLCCLLIFSSGICAWAQEFYVVSVNRKPKNIITVAKSGGDFTDPVAAVDSISDASATNPYLVVIAPGVYTVTQTLQMKQYVDIAGSGEEVTKLTGAIKTGYSSVVVG
jgi:pectin methylesterase-like acyl-CoA thioesterase